MAALSLGALLCLVAATTAAPALPMRWDRNMLRQVVTACAMIDKATGVSFPCADVQPPTPASIGYARVRSPGFASEWLIVPTAPFAGIESAGLRSGRAVPLWGAAWATRLAVEEELGRRLGRGAIGLAVNSKGTRTQDQFHIHVDCLHASVARAVEARAGEITDHWARFPKRLRGDRYWARAIHSSDLDGVNVLQMVADGLPGAADAMGRVTLAVVPARLGDGSAGFVLLANTANSSAEQLLDHSCRGV